MLISLGRISDNSHTVIELRAVRCTNGRRGENAPNPQDGGSSGETEGAGASSMDLGVRQKKRTASLRTCSSSQDSSHCVAPVRINKETSSTGRRGGPAGGSLRHTLLCGHPTQGDGGR